MSSKWRFSEIVRERLFRQPLFFPKLPILVFVETSLQIAGHLIDKFISWNLILDYMPQQSSHRFSLAGLLH